METYVRCMQCHFTGDDLVVESVEPIKQWSTALDKDDYSDLLSHQIDKKAIRDSLSNAYSSTRKYALAGVGCKMLPSSKTIPVVTIVALHTTLLVAWYLTPVANTGTEQGIPWWLVARATE